MALLCNKYNVSTYVVMYLLYIMVLNVEKIPMKQTSQAKLS